MQARLFGLLLFAVCVALQFRPLILFISRGYRPLKQPQARARIPVRSRARNHSMPMQQQQLRQDWAIFLPNVTQEYTRQCGGKRAQRLVPISTGMDFLETVQKTFAATPAAVTTVRRSDLVQSILPARGWYARELTQQNLAALSPDTVGVISRGHGSIFSDIARALRGGFTEKAALLFFEYQDDVAANKSKRSNSAQEPIPAVAVFLQAEVSKIGDVFSCNTGVAFKGCNCYRARGCMVPQMPTKRSARQYDTVAVIAQHQGQHFFHFMYENLVRVGVILDILKANPTISVHVARTDTSRVPAYTKQVLQLLGVGPHRIIHGEIYANRVIIPEPSACGNPSMAPILLLRPLLLEALGMQHGQVPNSRNILVIQRTETRVLTNFNELVNRLKQAFDGFNVVIFNSTASLPDQLRQFASASLIVGAHGAALSNLLVAHPRAAVVEFLSDNDRLNTVNPCYMLLSFKLGLVYRTYVPSGAGHDSKEWTLNVTKAVELARDAIAHTIRKR